MWLEIRKEQNKISFLLNYTKPGLELHVQAALRCPWSWPLGALQKVPIDFKICQWKCPLQNESGVTLSACSKMEFQACLSHTVNPLLATTRPHHWYPDSRVCVQYRTDTLSTIISLKFYCFLVDLLGVSSPSSALKKMKCCLSLSTSIEPLCWIVLRAFWTQLTTRITLLKYWKTAPH